MRKKIVVIFIAILMLISILGLHFPIEISEAKQISIQTIEDITIFDNSYGVQVSCDENQMTVYPNETAVYCVEVTNTGTEVDTYLLDCPDLIDCCYWSSLTSYGLNLSPSETGITVLIVTPYEEQEETYTITVRATSTNDPTVSDSVPTYTTVILDDRIIDVSTDKPVYVTGETISLIITNIGQETIEGNPSFEVFNEDGDLVYGCYPECWIPLEPGESFDCPWEPNVPQGKYVVKGWFTTYTDTYFDNATFFIFENKQIDVTTDKLGYNSGENVSLMITNIGNTTIDGNPSFDIFDKEGNIVFSLRIYLWIELEPGETWFWEWDQKDDQGQQVPNGTYLLEGHLNTQHETYIDHTLFYIGENNPPNKPTIKGPTRGKVGQTYEYTISTTDPEGNDVWYLVGWGDKTTTGWIGPYKSGKEITISHSWNIKMTFTIRVQAKDIFNEKSEVATLSVTIPRNKQSTNTLFLQFLERFMYHFPLLARLLNLQ